MSWCHLHSSFPWSFWQFAGTCVSSPQLQGRVAGLWAVPALLSQPLVSVRGCLFRGFVKQNEILRAKSLHDHLSNCHEVAKMLLLEHASKNRKKWKAVCVRFSRCHISIMHFVNSQKDQPLLRLRRILTCENWSHTAGVCCRSTAGLRLRLWRRNCSSNVIWNTRHLASAKDKEAPQSASVFFPLSGLTGFGYILNTAEKWNGKNNSWSRERPNKLCCISLELKRL